MQLAIEHLPAAGPAEQLLLLLHGWAQEPQALAPLADALRAGFPQAAILVPEGPSAADGGRRGRMWYSIEGLNSDPVDPAEWPRRVQAQLGALHDWVRAQQRRLGVPAAATCLGGFSQGGVLSLELVARHDGIAGRVLAFGARFAELPEAAPRQTTLHFFHGDADRVFPVEHLRHTLRHLAERDGDASIDIASGVGHELHPALVRCALQRLHNHIPLRTWRAALGAEG